MTLPSSNTPDPPISSSPTPSGARSTRSQQLAWGPSNQLQSGRRGLTPISTGFGASQTRQNAASDTPSRLAFSPSNPSTSFNQPASRQFVSRQSSGSSSSPLLSPTSSGPQPLTANSLLASTRHRPSNSHLTSSATHSSFQAGGGGIAGGGGVTAKATRASSSISASTTGSLISSVNSSGHSGVGQPGQLTSLVVAQIVVLLSTLKDFKDRTKWEAQADQIRRLVNANGMEVFVKYFRRLVGSNANHIFSGSKGSSDPNGSYTMLVEEMQKLTRDPEQAARITESLNTAETDLFKDFDLSAFMDHFRLSPVAKITLALACRTVQKPDIRTKERIIQEPPRTWNEDSKTSLQYALKLRYHRLDIHIPVAVSATLSLIEIFATHSALVRLVQRAGPESTASLDACKEMLAGAETRDIGYQQVASALLYMAISQSGQPYDLSVFIAALRQHRAGQRLDWQDVVHAFDRETLRITKAQFLVLYNALVPLAKEYENFDIQSLWGNTWTHVDTQLSFVVAFLSLRSDELDASQIPRLRPAFTLDEFEDAPEDVKAYAVTAVKHPMVSLDATRALFTEIFRSQEAYNQAQGLDIPGTVINPNTDIFVCAASTVQKPLSGLQDQALKQLAMPFFRKEVANHSFALHALWKHDPFWLATKMVDEYNRRPSDLKLIFEHAKEHNWFDALMSISGDITIDLAALAHSQGIYDPVPWAQRNLVDSGILFARAVSSFLQNRAEDDLLVQRDGVAPTFVPLAVTSVHAYLDVLQGNLGDDELGHLERECVRVYPRLINYGEGFDDIIDRNGAHGNAMSEAADAQMQEEYKRMYGNEPGSDVRSMITKLKGLKTSHDQQDQDLFACMVHGLFDEYNCFGEYPLEALAITAVLFGGIINFNLLSRAALHVALLMVLEAVSRYAPEDRMFKFGLQALLHFKDRLEEWPTYCERLLSIPHLHGTEIYTKAQEVFRSQAGPDINGDAQNGLSLTNGNVDEFIPPDSPVAPFASLKVDPPLRPDMYEDPDEEVSDKVMFVLNNVSKRNLEEKFHDLKAALEERHHQWFAQYLVEELAKSQPNFQVLYLELLKSFDHKTLWAEVMRETYISVARMLNAESTMNSTTERVSLKNLAAWLGALTLARNKPILHRNISFKDLLLEACDSQRLLVVIPFTCKVFSKAAESMVFKPPNPWIMELIGLLIELYHFAEMKLNLKFEIEVLCKELNLDHNTLEPGDILRSRPMVVENDYLQTALPDGMEGFGDLSLMTLSRRTPNERFSLATITAQLPDLGTVLKYPPSVGHSHTQLKQIFLSAAQQAIQEIIAPVVERSVTIAAISTTQLVKKDFATEGDPDRLRDAAHNVVKALSGSLALVTCKEPLRMSITNNIRLAARSLAEQSQSMQLPEGSILMFVNDNLDTVCNMVENAAEQQSLAEIDSQIEEHLEKRRRHREIRPNETFLFPNVSRWATFVPEPYRLEPHGLNAHQMAMYEEFGRQARAPLGHTNSVSQDSGRQVLDLLTETYPNLPALPTPAEAPAVPRPVQQQHQRLPEHLGMITAPSQPQVNGYVDFQSIADRVRELLAELQQAAREASEQHIDDLAPNAHVADIYKELIAIIDRARAVPRTDEFFAGVALHLVAVVYQDTKKRLELEVFVRLLSHICRISSSGARLVSAWIDQLHSEREEQAFNPAVVDQLVKFDILHVQRIDLQLARAIKERKPYALEFLRGLVEELFVDVDPVALRGDLALALGQLAQWMIEDNDLEVGKQIMSKLTPAHTTNGVPSPPESDKHDQLEYIFEEWLALQRPGASDHAVAFIDQLHDGQVLNTSQKAQIFFRVCMDQCLETYANEAILPAGSLNRAYSHVDSFAKLIVALTVHRTGQGSEYSKVSYFDTTLALLVMILTSHHDERPETFNPKVFFRFFSSLLCELHQVGTTGPLDPFDWQQQFPLALCRAMVVLQPMAVQGFSFAWLTLIGHRYFVPYVLNIPGDTGSIGYLVVLGAAFQYLGLLLADMDRLVAAQTFYRGLLKVVVALHHDYPEFLAEYHWQLNAGIPTQCTQLHNIINEAVPRNVQSGLPNPFAPGLKINRLDASREAPIIKGDPGKLLQNRGVKDTIDVAVLASEISDHHFTQIVSALKPDRNDFMDVPGTTISILMLNALMVYIGESSTVSSSVFTGAATSAKLLQRLARDLDHEMRYHYIGAIINQLRYPCSHTHYFSGALLHLFTTGSEVVQEQILRVLLERMLTPKPQPWGLIVTILELAKNPDYNISELPWLKASPESAKAYTAAD
ncbi:CCR4-NOT core subunit cdc39 [Elasticomyces elasticus]|nr:CCR4-NOT core subunit cdc39 [Elasticomyces elasticus]